MDLKAAWNKFVDILMPPPPGDEPYDDVTVKAKEPVDAVGEEKQGFGQVITGMFARKTAQAEMRQVVNGDPVTYGSELDDDGYVDEPEPQQPERPKFVVHEAPKLKVRIYTPTSFDQAAGIADDLRDKRAVVVNYERVETELQRRICDFINGVCYVLDGCAKRISAQIVLYVPEGVDVDEAMSMALPY